MAVVIVLLTLFSVSVPPSPSCCSPGVACTGGPACAVPPPPSPTVVIGPGVSFNVRAGSYDFLSFQPSSATEMSLNGSLEATEGTVIYLLTPDTFANLTTAPGAFNCTAEMQQGHWCVAAAAAPGTVHWLPNSYTVPTYNQSGVALSWYLVMQNPNASIPSTVTWLTGLVASYFDISG